MSQVGIAWVMLDYFRLRRLHFGYTFIMKIYQGRTIINARPPASRHDPLFLSLYIRPWVTYFFRAYIPSPKILRFAI